MITIALKIDKRSERGIDMLLPKKQYEAAIKRCISRSVSSAYTAGNRAIISEYKIKMGDVRSLSEKIPQKGQIRYGGGHKGRMLTTTHFRVSPKSFVSQKGVPVKRRRKYTITIKNRVSTRWFALPGKIPNMLWERTGSGPKAVRPVKGISIAQMANKKVQQIVQQKMQEEFDKRIDNELEQIFKKAGGK